MLPTAPLRARTHRWIRFAALAALLCLTQAVAAAQTLKLGIQLEPPLLDPTVSAAAPISEVVYGNVFEGLVRLDSHGEARPALAKSWEISQDGLTYRFHLRDGVRFHDGSAFTAETARFSLDRVRDEKSVNAQRSLLAAVSRITAPAPDELLITLKRRSGGLLQALGDGALVMVSPTSIAGNAQKPVGTGPFRFSAWRRGESITLQRNPDYWGQAPRIERLTFRFIADPNAAYSALMAGDIELFPNFPAPENIAQFKADKRFVVEVGSSEGEAILALNNRKAPLNNLLVRRAISHALDRREIIDGAMYGYGEPIGSHFPPRNSAYLDLTGRYPHDVGKARGLLAEAGFPDGITISLKLPPTPYARRSGEIIAAQLAQAGIRARIENIEWSQWMDQVYTRHDFDATIVVHSEPLDYPIYGRDDYYFGYDTHKIKALLASLDESVDPLARRALLQKIQRTIADDAVNGFLFQHPRLTVRSASLVGLPEPGVVNASEVGSASFTSAAGASSSASALASQALFALATALAALLLWALLRALRRVGLPWLGRRALSLFASLLVASLVVFLLLQWAPGDPVRLMMGLNADPLAVANMRSELGLDAPAALRYLHWLLSLAHGDLGISVSYRVPVATLLAERLAVSVPLAALALALAVLLAFPLGVLGAHWRQRWPGRLLDALTQLGIAVPNFWVGVLLSLVFAVTLGWLPAGGFPGWEHGGAALASLILPALALALPQAAVLASVLRAALIAQLGEDYIRTARAKGLSAFACLWRHALPNALIPVLTLLGMQFSFLLAGTIIIENVFFLPGLGRLIFQAVTQHDLILLQNLVMLLIFAIVLVSFVVELFTHALDPRVQARAGS
jgi:ABC-type transport system substrate-binding protein/ABC-type dipeptide/oligopeptide/nickel transport system permease component